MCAMSLPAIKGEAIIAQSEKCERYSAGVIPPLPTSSMSASFQCPGPANGHNGSFKSTISSTEWAQECSLSLVAKPSQMSPVVRQELPMFLAHSHGFAVPHSHIEKTMSRP